MPVGLSMQGFRGALRAKRVRLVAERMLAALALSHCELSVLLCDDRTIHVLNRDYRQMDKPTDVLAFAMREAGAPQSHLLGDIVISIDTATRQAADADRPVDDEIDMLLAHGLLHLLGFDHRDRTEERRMVALTDALRSTARGAFSPTSLGRSPDRRRNSPAKRARS